MDARATGPAAAQGQRAAVQGGLQAEAGRARRRGGAQGALHAEGLPPEAGSGLLRDLRAHGTVQNSPCGALLGGQVGPRAGAVRRADGVLECACGRGHLHGAAGRI